MTAHDRDGLLLVITAVWAWFHGAWCMRWWCRRGQPATSGHAPHKESP